MSMQELLPPIVATLMAAGLLLAERHRAAAEVERLRAIEQRRIEEERHQQGQDCNRTRRLIEIARAWRDVELAREFISRLGSW